MNYLYVALGGALGSVLRFAVGNWLGSTVGTWWVNVLGSFCIGLLSTWAGTGVLSEQGRVLLMVGVLGGFTTFSSFTLEGQRLLATQPVWGAAYIASTVVVSLLGFALGTKIAHL